MIARKKYNHPFVALLMAAAEIEDEGEWITAEGIHENLLLEIPLPAIRNLLHRLYLLGLLHLENSDEYSLTELGRASAVDRSIWIEEQGLYRIGVCDSKFIPQFVVDVKDIPKRNDAKEDRKDQPTPRRLRNLIDQELLLQNESVMVLSIEEQCFRIGSNSATLEIKFSEKGGIVKLRELGSAKAIEYSLDLPTFNEAKARREIMVQHFGERFDEDSDLVYVPFDKDRLQLVRNEAIAAPIFQEVGFEKVELRDVQFTPATKDDADKWHVNLCVSEMDRYFLNDDEFQMFQAAIAQRVRGVHQPSALKRSQMIKALQAKEKLFYRLAKVQTIDFLNY